MDSATSAKECAASDMQPNLFDDPAPGPDSERARTIQLILATLERSSIDTTRLRDDYLAELREIQQ